MANIKRTNSEFQIRSSWPQFHGIVRFERLDFSISCVFSMGVISAIPPTGTTPSSSLSVRLRAGSPFPESPDEGISA